MTRHPDRSLKFKPYAATKIKDWQIRFLAVRKAEQNRLSDISMPENRELQSGISG